MSEHDEEVEQYNPETEFAGFEGANPAEKVTPLRPNRPYNSSDLVLGAVPAVQTTVQATCLHCGDGIGEYTNIDGGYLVHPPIDGDKPHNLYVTPKDVTAGPAFMSKMLGMWIRAIHKLDKPVIQSFEPPSPQFTEAHVDPHMQKIFHEIVQQPITQLAGAIHIIELLGPMKQTTFRVYDSCGFEGEIVLRVKNICNEEAGVRNVDEGTAKTHPESPEERLLRDIFRGHGHRSPESDPGDEEYTHDPGDPSHDPEFSGT